MTREQVMVAVAGDPGGAAALAPVLQALQRSPIRLRLWPYRQAGQVWARAGLPVEPLPSGPPRDAAERLTSAGADGLLLATSVNGVDWERAFLAAAHVQGVPSLAVLDFWTNYAARFTSLRRGDLPDGLAIMDESARTAMIAAGFPADILRVTGQPAFDDWVQTPALPASAVAAEPVVLFLSQPLLDLYGPDLQAPGHPGFTEREVVEALARALSHLARARRQLIHLVIRPHPREDPSSFRDLAGEGLRVRVEKDGTLVEALAAADLAVGMTTMALLEASVRGRVVLSVQPRGRDGDPVPRFAAPGLVRCYDVAELPAVLASLLFDEDRRAEVRARAGAARPQPGAARRVADWMISSMRPAGAGGG